MIQTSEGPSILVCEDQAHIPHGHWGVRFAELAIGFKQAGCNVHVLTGMGWFYEKDFNFPPENVHRYGRISRLLFRAGSTKQSFLPQQPIHKLLTNIALIIAARKTLKALKIDRALIVVVSAGMEPALLSLFPGNHDWIVHCFRNTPRKIPAMLQKLYSICNANRVSNKSRFIIAVPDEEAKSNWKRLRMYHSINCLRLAGAVSLPVDVLARDKLGLPKAHRIALLFGTTHNMKWPQTAIDAMNFLPDWTLYIVGTGAAYLGGSASDSFLPKNVVLRPGVVSLTERNLWHQAADLAILSFAPNYRRNSGTLMDALSAGCPVAVSDDSFAADLVRKYSLGKVFVPGSAEGLSIAVRQTKPLHPELLEIAMNALGNKRLAIEHLSVVK